MGCGGSKEQAPPKPAGTPKPNSDPKPAATNKPASNKPSNSAPTNQTSGSGKSMNGPDTTKTNGDAAPTEGGSAEFPTEYKKNKADTSEGDGDGNVLLTSVQANFSVLMAVNRLQRTARRKKAMKVAQAEQQWKMFADLDTQDEAEMLHLAVFMQTLIDSVPGQKGSDGQTPADKLGDDSDAEDEGDFKAIKLESIEIKDTMGRSLRLDQDYEVPHSKIDSSAALDIINVIRQGGTIGRKTVVKILRRAYKMFQKQDNVTHMTVANNAKLTVVGDLHGQLTDLLHILDESGMPSQTNKFIFNGDFVDRGEKGVEIVIILFALFIAEGHDVVALNRGNHEDLPVCRVYGFENEVKAKYDDLLFEMFAEVFNYLPLFALVNKSVFVVHGGLFHTPDVKIDELNEIVRHDYYVKPPVPYPQNIKGLKPADARKEFMKQLQRDALWSDPTDEEGCYLNPRGAGVSFGPDIAKEFMDKNGVDMVVRSHECVYHGFDLPYAVDDRTAGPLMGVSEKVALSDANPAGLPLLCTLFSASNYIGGDNEGAFIMFLTHKFTDSHPVGGKSNLHYAVQRYKTSAATTEEIIDNNNMSLRELILKRKAALNSAFEAADEMNLGVVSRNEWAEIMQRVTQIKIRWLSIINAIAPPESLSASSVAYKVFLSKFSVANNAEGTGVQLDNEMQVTAMDDMYGQRKKLETVFYFFDSNGDGMISREEFRQGCDVLNKNLHPDYRLTDIDHTLEMMDFDGSGTIDINEFFETFRILDSKDGKVDGVISLADTARKNSAPTQQMQRELSLKAKQALLKG